MQWSIVGNEGGEQWLTVADPSYSKIQSMHSSHPGFAAVTDQVERGETPDESAFDPAEAVREAFRELGERVSVKGSVVYLDGDPIDNSCTKAILRFLDEGVEDWLPLVRFFERVQANPSDESREQLYSFLAANSYTITPDGNIVGYKAVHEVEDGVFRSIWTGQPGDVQVNGEDADARPLQSVGDVVSMQRSQVDPNKFVHCSVGLHVAAYAYASGWFGGHNSPVLRVIVNPADVVSVPTDENAQKMRVSKYRIEAVIDEPDDVALYADEGEVVAVAETDVVTGRFDEDIYDEYDGGW